ncbi:hypothetical protein PI125_g19578 [Phytophthora idaei]|nr:hypothetical protein PI125_g19578 [Phytophthora idaei]
MKWRPIATASAAPSSTMCTADCRSKPDAAISTPLYVSRNCRAEPFSGASGLRTW